MLIMFDAILSYIPHPQGILRLRLRMTAGKKNDSVNENRLPSPCHPSRPPLSS